MNTSILRVLIVGVNFSLIGANCWMGYGISGIDAPKLFKGKVAFRPVDVPKKEIVPDLDVREYQIKNAAIERRSEVSFAPIWKTFRKAIPVKKDPKPKPGPVKPPPPRPVGPGVVTARYKLVGVTINKQDPKRSTIFMKRKSGGNRILVKVGEGIPETPFTLSALAVATETSIKATLRDKTGKTSDITMKRGEKK
ncbi:MAG: hypothetical protein P1V97_26660 [Planctomycetota bacterium]|nr:hypothetical protein [Planctomycetota bacterium]